MDFTPEEKQAVLEAWRQITETTDFPPLPDGYAESWLRQFPAIVVVASIGSASHREEPFEDDRHLRNYIYKTLPRMAANWRSLQAAAEMLREAGADPDRAQRTVLFSAP